MKKLTVEFNIHLDTFGNSEFEIKTFEFKNHETDQEIDDYLSAAYGEWVLETIGGGWNITKTEEIPNEN